MARKTITFTFCGSPVIPNRGLTTEGKTKTGADWVRMSLGVKAGTSTEFAGLYGTGERYDCRAYTRNRDENGNWEKYTTPITLDRQKKYIVAFLDKTRNDEDKQQVLYEVNFSWNSWREIGYCNIKNEHVTASR